MFQELAIELLHRYSHPEPNKAWETIHNHYNQAGRYYHNLEHVQKMINELLPVQSLINEWDTILFAIIYHDIVYDPSSQTNEFDSALFFEQELIESTFKQFANCKKQILATAKHGKSIDSDTNYLLDVDLAILGSPWIEYQKYTHNIRQEYNQYNDAQYFQGRLNVLQHFSTRKQIYKTERFINKFEKQARLNLQQEIEVLRG